MLRIEDDDKLSNHAVSEEIRLICERLDLLERKNGLSRDELDPQLHRETDRAEAQYQELMSALRELIVASLQSIEQLLARLESKEPAHQ